MKKELSIIIINFNGENYLKNCLTSIYEKTQNIDYEIIIFDNASNDNSCKYIKQNHPSVILIESNTNLGFGNGNNYAVKYAKGKFLLLLNNDTILLNPIEEILETYKKLKNVGFLGINMLNSEKQYIPAAGRLPNPINMLLFKYLFYRNQEFKNGHFDKPIYEVGWLSGSFMMVEKDLFDKINGFDNRYFMYVEDVDICKRIHEFGYTNYFLSEYFYIHFVGFKKTKNHLIIESYKKYINIHFKGIEKHVLLLEISINKFLKKLMKKYK